MVNYKYSRQSYRSMLLQLLSHGTQAYARDIQYSERSLKPHVVSALLRCPWESSRSGLRTAVW